MNKSVRPRMSFPLTNPFLHQSQLKQRIQMLQKPQSSRRALFSYALLLPIVAGLLMCTQTENPADQLPLNASLPLTQVKGEIFTIVEEQPEFPGGMAELGTYLGDNLHYPEAARKANVEGKVFVSFIVTTNGQIADVKVLKGVGFGTDEEAIRVVSRMPRWEPGKQNGNPVNLRYNLPINFQLKDN